MEHGYPIIPDFWNVELLYVGVCVLLKVSSRPSGLIRKHSLREGKLTLYNGKVVGKLKIVLVVLTRRLPRYSSIIIHIVTVQF